MEAIRVEVPKELHGLDAPLKFTYWPPLLVIQGESDPVVAARNGAAAAQMWADAVGAKPSTARILRRGQRHPMTVTDFKRRGRTLTTLVAVDRLGHAWSGGASRLPYGDEKGPDASRMAWAFASRQFRLPHTPPLER